MKSRIAAVACLLVVACGGNTPAPQPVPEPQPAAQAEVPRQQPEERVIGSVRVNASTLNVRAEASASSAIVGHTRRGERLALLAESGDWLRVRLGDGATGWVSAQHVVREGAAARPRRGGCPPDSDYSFAKPPKPAFAENGPHGIVVVEATVNAQGVVTATRIVSNETHDAALAAVAEGEIRGARFNPPIRNCAPKAFFFTYKRAF